TKHAAVGTAEQRRREHRMSRVGKLEDRVFRVLFELLAVGTRCQAKAKDSVSRCAARTGVPQQKAAVLLSNGGRKNVPVVELAGIAKRNNRSVGVALPDLRHE